MSWYPECLDYDKNKEFLRNNFPMPSARDITTKTEVDIVAHFQSHNLIHTCCPQKLCSRYNIELHLTFEHNKRGELKCRLCQNFFLCRPRALRDVEGDLSFVVRL